MTFLWFWLLTCRDLPVKKKLYMEPCDDFEEYGIVKSFWGGSYMSGGTAQEFWNRSACVQWRCVVATWLLTAWLMGDERAVINPPHLISHKCKRTSVSAKNFQRTWEKERALLWESEEEAMRHLSVWNALINYMKVITISLSVSSL